MIQLLAAIGATAAALVELSLVPYLRIGDAIRIRCSSSASSGRSHRASRPGSSGPWSAGSCSTASRRDRSVSAFALVICVGAAAAIARSFVRIRPLAPVIAVPIVSLVYSMILFGLIAAIRPPVVVGDPVATLMPGAAYDAVLRPARSARCVALDSRPVPRGRAGRLVSAGTTDLENDRARRAIARSGSSSSGSWSSCGLASSASACSCCRSPTASTSPPSPRTTGRRPGRSVSTRGVIYDRTGAALVTNVPSLHGQGPARRSPEDRARGRRGALWPPCSAWTPPTSTSRSTRTPDPGSTSSGSRPTSTRTSPTSSPSHVSICPGSRSSSSRSREYPKDRSSPRSSATRGRSTRPSWRPCGARATCPTT